MMTIEHATHRIVHCEGNWETNKPRALTVSEYGEGSLNLSALDPTASRAPMAS
jgi:hypothetical protein